MGETGEMSQAGTPRAVWDINSFRSPMNFDSAIIILSSMIATPCVTLFNGEEITNEEYIEGINWLCAC